jgi:orotate phosphoribosyltransferase-like protein
MSDDAGDTLVGYNEDEVEMINRVRRYGTRGMATFSSAEGLSISKDAAKHLVPAKS